MLNNSNWVLNINECYKVLWKFLFKKYLLNNNNWVLNINECYKRFGGLFFKKLFNSSNCVLIIDECSITLWKSLSGVTYKERRKYFVNVTVIISVLFV